MVILKAEIQVIENGMDITLLNSPFNTMMGNLLIFLTHGL